MRFASRPPVCSFTSPLLVLALAGLVTVSAFGQTTGSTAADPHSKDPQVKALEAQVAQLQSQLRAIGSALATTGTAPMAKPAEPTIPTAPSSSSTKALTRAEVAALQAQMAELETKYAALAETVTNQNGQLSPLKEQVDQVSKTVQSLAAAPAPPAPSLVTPEQASAVMASVTGSNLAATPTGVSMNIMWTLVTGYLVMFMQAGFALVETGFTRAKNAAHTMSMNFMVYVLGMLGYWVCGFAIQFGGTGALTSASPVSTLGTGVPTVLNSELGFSVGSHFFGLCGGHGYFLAGTSYDPGIFTLFLFQMVFMDTTATIPTGAMAERWRFLPFCLFSLVVGAFIYPLFGNWVWGGGWLASLGKNFGLGHGHVDFAGSSVVHMTGGVLALAGALFLGPRIGKYNADGSPNPIPGHNIPMAMLGTFILAFGWFGFNPGSTLAATDTQIGIVATNTMLASAAGAVTAMLIAWVRIGKPDPAFMCNGMLAGLVAITAPCAFVDAWAAVVLGAIAGFIMYVSVFFVEEKLRVDDPVGAISVHGSCGCWGVLSIGIFGNGRYGDAWNAVPGKVTGFLYGDSGAQFAAECIGALTNFIVVFSLGWVTLLLIERFLGGNRTSEEAEMEGLDIPEMGTLGYNNDI